MATQIQTVTLIRQSIIDELNLCEQTWLYVGLRLKGIDGGSCTANAKEYMLKYNKGINLVLGSTRDELFNIRRELLNCIKELHEQKKEANDILSALSDS